LKPYFFEGLPVVCGKRGWANPKLVGNDPAEFEMLIVPPDIRSELRERSHPYLFL
jgi:hypothetical protein